MWFVGGLGRGTGALGVAGVQFKVVVLGVFAHVPGGRYRGGHLAGPKRDVCGWLAVSPSRGLVIGDDFSCVPLSVGSSAARPSVDFPVPFVEVA